jgi:Tfp pilus assembly protein PilZ
VDLNVERRKHRRFVYEADITHDILAHKKIYKGKLYNFSKGGLYFESDQNVYPGEEVFIKFNDQPESTGNGMLAHLPFGVEIVWQNNLTDSSFRYGYGANYLDTNDSLVRSVKIAETQQEKSQDNTQDAEKDPRDYPRRQSHKTLQLTYKGKNYKGEIKNISSGGVYIKTGIRFTAGKQIRIVIPGSKFRKESKLEGRIVRINSEGFGVEFSRKSGRDIRRQSESTSTPA